MARKHKKRRTKNPYRGTIERIKNRVSIALRPTQADDREIVGHWESDSMVGSDRKSALNVALERVTRLVNISLMKNKTAQETKSAVTRRLSKHPDKLVKSITYDNASENVLHQEINDKLGVQSFFCEPYHSWEKGSIEQVNGLIRRYLPNGTDFNNVTAAEINRIEKLINNRPRKCLNYRTPYEMFRLACGALKDLMWDFLSSPRTPLLYLWSLITKISSTNIFLVFVGSSNNNLLTLDVKYVSLGSTDDPLLFRI